MKKSDPVILFIDTSEIKKTTVKIFLDQTHQQAKNLTTREHSQAILPLIDNLLRELQLTLNDITAIKVHPGPGSFTGLRVGVAVAATLSLLLDIPLNDKKQTKPPEIIYAKDNWSDCAMMK